MSRLPESREPRGLRGPGGRLRVLPLRIWRTLQLAFLALLPSRGGAPEPGVSGEVRECEPLQIRGGMGRFLDEGGELRLFFPECLAPAAPFLLFRLKREGFSRCSVEATERGLLLRGRR